MFTCTAGSLALLLLPGTGDQHLHIAAQTLDDPHRLPTNQVLVFRTNQRPVLRSVDQSDVSIHLVVADAEEGLGVDGEDHVAHLQPGLKQEPCITLCRQSL